MNALLVVIIASCQNGVKHFLLFSVFTNNGDGECSYVVPALWSHCCESQHKFLALLFAFPLLTSSHITSCYSSSALGIQTFVHVVAFAWDCLVPGSHTTESHTFTTSELYSSDSRSSLRGFPA